jgi:hypothetical protein
MRPAIQSHHDHGHYHLPRQGLWFVLMLITLFLLLSKTAFA